MNSLFWCFLEIFRWITFKIFLEAETNILMYFIISAKVLVFVKIKFSLLYSWLRSCVKFETCKGQSEENKKKNQTFDSKIEWFLCYIFYSTDIWWKISLQSSHFTVNVLHVFI